MNEEDVATTNDARSEWIKFGILIAVFVIVILVVALSRPLIFGHIVPAVMGTGQVRMPVATEPIDAQPGGEVEQLPANEAYPAPGTTPSAENPTPAVNTESENVNDTAGQSPTPTEQTPTGTAGETSNDQPLTPTVVSPSTNTLTYTVRAGDTLYHIARRYGTTPEAIVAASDNLTSLNDIITPGMEITVPLP